MMSLMMNRIVLIEINESMNNDNIHLMIKKHTLSNYK